MVAFYGILKDRELLANEEYRLEYRQAITRVQFLLIVAALVLIADPVSTKKFSSLEQISPATVRPQVFGNVETMTFGLSFLLKTVSRPSETVPSSLPVVNFGQP